MQALLLSSLLLFNINYLGTATCHAFFKGANICLAVLWPQLELARSDFEAMG